jgi:hypothetical protein
MNKKINSDNCEISQKKYGFHVHACLFFKRPYSDSGPKKGTRAGFRFALLITGGKYFRS